MSCLRSCANTCMDLDLVNELIRKGKIDFKTTAGTEF